MLKYPPLVQSHTWRRLRRSFIASLIMLCSKPRQIYTTSVYVTGM